MSKLRYGASFEDLWARRTTVDSDDGPVEMVAIADLVQSKKTQRSKDWPVIERLVDQSYFSCEDPHEPDVRFWCRELRSPGVLGEVLERFSDIARSETRPAVLAGLRGGFGRH